MICKRRKIKETGTISWFRSQMHKHRPMSIFFLYAFLGCMFVSYTFARDSMTLNSSIRDEHGETLISIGEKFELGFFSPSENLGDRRYLGIWYYQSNPKTVVWIANRDVPVLDSKGEFAFTEGGNLNVLDGSGKLHWRTNLVVSSPMLLSLRLMDNGNLVIIKDVKDQLEMILWQSFNFPTDTFLPGMKMDDNMTLTSWRDYNDPSPGNFTFQLDQEGTNQYVVWRRSIRYWKSGVSGKFITSDDMPYVLSYFLSNYTSSIINNNSVPYITSSLFSNTRLILTYTGQVRYLKWDSLKVWSMVWAEPRDKCSVYNRCGNFGSCNRNNDVVCKCLPGFEPSSQELWDSGDFSGGCVRKSVMCSKDAISDTFLGLNSMKVGKPDSQFMAKNEEECKTECLNNCQCQAFSYEVAERALQEGTGSGTCWIWSEDLNNLQDGYDDGRNIYIRLAASDIASTVRSCLACGTNLIPYPLSTGPNCGDPMYFRFHCNTSIGVVSFMAPGGTYQVTRIIPESRTFFIKLKPEDSCEAVNRSITPKERHDFPFQASSWCDAGGNNTSSKASTGGRDEIGITWKLPHEPVCSASSDCKDWPDSSCNETLDGQKRCICNSSFQWDPEHINCTLAKKHEGSSYGKMSSSLIITVTFASTVVLMVLLSTTGFVYMQKRNAIKRKEKWWNIQRNSANRLYDSDRHVKSMIDSSRFKEDDTEGIDAPFFDLETILSATDSFSNANKLGQGGFGQVFKGKFPGGRAIAVKRLSSFSGQGFEEFKNEVVLIARLQHRNLVRLVGYCVEAEEKILLYEYMPNKSLDSFIFDRNLCMSLDWNTRFKIILGIARGLLYLHQDSRLRIIHRDLKTSNILLDEEMNPKISDFGLARIFGGKETAANTNRVVGTYGYMSPEYALDGFFSVKSDVFSFGVVVLEVITGKRNIGFYEPENSLSLLGYTWKLWKEEKAVDLVEPTYRRCYNIQEYLRCVNVGLLCVQEDPNDRPVMSDVVFMLGSENATLPTPKPPAFVVRRCPSSSRGSMSSKQETWSHNKLTVTLENGR